jgi:hypothetical protein
MNFNMKAGNNMRYYNQTAHEQSETINHCRAGYTKMDRHTNKQCKLVILRLNYCESVTVQKQ